MINVKSNVKVSNTYNECERNFEYGVDYVTKIFSSKEYFYIDSVKQGIIIETNDTSLPVLLIVHGGPGLPVFPIMKANKINLHTIFTVCYWDQRGTGMSYTSDSEGMTIEQMVCDTIHISRYLCDKFNSEKIFILGHSWGTLLARLAASDNPSLYHAYIGVGQVSIPQESEKETYQYLLKKVKDTNNKKWIAEVEGFEFNHLYYKSQKYNIIRSKYTEKFGVGFLRRGYSNFQIIKDIILAPVYTLTEKRNVIAGMFNSYKVLSKPISTTNLLNKINQFEVPVYILQGRYDFLTSHYQATKFYQHIKAPKKELITFEQSAHAPFIDEKEKFISKLKEIIISNE